MEWTETRVGQLKRLWRDGHSASHIAEQLGGVTRNAVIGKAHRLGLSSRPSPIRRGTPSVSTAGERICHWPIGHPREEGFHFCGKPAEAARPYCGEHCAVAYRRKSETAA